jgi:hypothetical protein
LIWDNGNGLEIVEGQNTSAWMIALRIPQQSLSWRQQQFFGRANSFFMCAAVIAHKLKGDALIINLFRIALPALPHQYLECG